MSTLLLDRIFEFVNYNVKNISRIYAFNRQKKKKNTLLFCFPYTNRGVF